MMNQIQINEMGNDNKQRKKKSLICTKNKYIMKFPE